MASKPQQLDLQFERFVSFQLNMKNSSSSGASLQDFPIRALRFIFRNHQFTQDEVNHFFTAPLLFLFVIGLCFLVRKWVVPQHHQHVGDDLEAAIAKENVGSKELFELILQTIDAQIQQCSDCLTRSADYRGFKSDVDATITSVNEVARLITRSAIGRVEVLKTRELRQSEKALLEARLANEIEEEGRNKETMSLRRGIYFFQLMWVQEDQFLLDGALELLERLDEELLEKARNEIGAAAAAHLLRQPSEEATHARLIIDKRIGDLNAQLGRWTQDINAEIGKVTEQITLLTHRSNELRKRDFELDANVIILVTAAGCLLYFCFVVLQWGRSLLIPNEQKHEYAQTGIDLIDSLSKPIFDAWNAVYSQVQSFWEKASSDLTVLLKLLPSLMVATYIQILGLPRGMQIISLGMMCFAIADLMLSLLLPMAVIPAVAALYWYVYRSWRIKQLRHRNSVNWWLLHVALFALLLWAISAIVGFSTLFLITRKQPLAKALPSGLHTFRTNFKDYVLNPVVQYVTQHEPIKSIRLFLKRLNGW